MLKKRLIGVIAVKDGWAVQSFGYNRYLPLGHPEYLAENLDRWGADEILVVCIDRSQRNLGPDFSLLNRLGQMGLSTPLTYAGGIQTTRQAAMVIQSGAERFCVDAVLGEDAASVREMAGLLGAQAIIAALPLSSDGHAVQWYDYRKKQTNPIPTGIRSLLDDGIISEVLTIDWQNEGRPSGFNMDIVRLLPFNGIPIIAFGGLSDSNQLNALLALPRVAAVGIGNFLSYSEHAIQMLKQKLGEKSLRPATYVDECQGIHP